MLNVRGILSILSGSSFTIGSILFSFLLFFITKNVPNPPIASITINNSIQYFFNISLIFY